MHELFPVLGGVVVGFLASLLRPFLRLGFTVLLSVVLGRAATVLSGEFRIGWEYLLLDVPLVAGAAVAADAVIRTTIPARLRTPGHVPRSRASRRWRMWGTGTAPTPFWRRGFGILIASR